MRDPHKSADKVPAAKPVGRKIRRALQKALARFPCVIEQLESLVAGKALREIPPEAVHEARRQVANEFAREVPAEPPRGMCPHMFALWRDEAQDPDFALPRWAIEGAPMGISQDIDRCGIFPPVYESFAPEQEIKQATLHWGNYQSAEDNPQVCKEILQNMVAQDWAIACHSWEELTAVVGSEAPQISRMALLSKPRKDGTMKHRIIWDLRRSWVNARIRQSERVMLPRPTDMVAAILDLWRLDPAGEIILFGCDVESAFHQVPVHSSEWKHAVTYLDGVWYVFKVLVFGAASAPTVWGRVAALMARSTAAIVPQDRVRLQVYVDDPLFAARGPARRAAEAFAIALLWILCLGFPISLAKLEAGSALSWIGVHFIVSPTAVTLTIPQDKLEELRAFTAEIAKNSVISAATLRKFAGKMAFAGGVIPQLRPVLWPLWAVLARAECPANDAAVKLGLLDKPGGREQRYFIHVRRIRRCLAWLTQFWRGRAGALRRVHPLVVPEPTLIMSTDASPWGIGGILQDAAGNIVSYFCDEVTQHDAEQLQGKRGEPDSQSVWELLAIVVALRAWSPRLVYEGVFRLRSDSMASLSALFRNSSPAGPMSKLLLMLSLHNAELVGGLRCLEHVPGVANVIPDRLSRVHSPQGEALPPELAAVERMDVARGSDFWLL